MNEVFFGASLPSRPQRKARGDTHLRMNASAANSRDTRSFGREGGNAPAPLAADETLLTSGA
jgi:hypothetical protein